MDDGTNIFFEKDDTLTDIADGKSSAKKSKADDSEFYDDMPREIVEYLIKTHPLNEDNVKTRRTPDDGRIGSRVSPDARVPKTRSAIYETKVPAKKPSSDFDEADTDEVDNYSYIDEEETVKKSVVRNYSSNPIVSTRIIIILVIVLVVLIMLFLVIRNSQLTKQLAEAEILVTQSIGIKDSNDSLKNQVDELNKEIAELKGNSTNSSQDDTTTTSENSNSSTATSSNTGSSADVQNTERTYTVQTGDNLSKISANFYGNAGYYQKIKDHNNLTSDTLSVGTVLKIPPLE